MSLHYKFPVINYIEDVLPHLKDHSEFIQVNKDGGYTVINYVYQSAETFPPVVDDTAAILRECRGLIFDTATGAIKSRAFHKFFNYGEREETQNIDLSLPHRIILKADGSLVRPLLVDGGIRWGTKMGLTDVSLQAETFAAVRPEYELIATACLIMGMTPIFEWMSRQQRIVLDYPTETLTLLAVRKNRCGTYLSRDDLIAMAEHYSVPLVEEISSSLTDLDAFALSLKERDDIEGVVLTFDDGHMVKIKTDWYVQLHRAKDKISRERSLIRLIIEDKVDDLLPALTESDRNDVTKFIAAVYHDLSVFSEAAYTVLKMIRHEGWDRGSFARRSGTYHPPIRAGCFHLFDMPMDQVQSAAREWAKGFVLKNLLGRAAMERARGVLLTARWKREITE